MLSFENVHPSNLKRSETRSTGPGVGLSRHREYQVVRFEAIRTKDSQDLD
jgi:hypothetical protein